MYFQIIIYTEGNDMYVYYSFGISGNFKEKNSKFWSLHLHHCYNGMLEKITVSLDIDNKSQGAYMFIASILVHWQPRGPLAAYSFT